MATIVRAEALITAQNKLRPGLTAATSDLKRFAANAHGINASIARAGAALRAAAPALSLGAAALAASSANKRFAEVERSFTRIGITGEAGTEATAEGLTRVRQLAYETAVPFEKLKDGMDALVSSGLSFEEALKFLPSVAKTAHASGASFEDIANSSLAVSRHLKISTRELQHAQDIMAAGGKAGQFELKDSAKELPALAPAAKAVGIEGTKGLARLVAMLQAVREGAGSSSEAATNLLNIFQKMESEETANKFKKFGVDLRKGMDNARKSGADLFDTFIGLTQKALKGDMSKLPQLFADAQVQQGMRPLLDSYARLAGEAKKFHDAQGTVETDLARVNKNAQSSLDRLSESFDRATTAAGSLISKFADPAIKGAAEGFKHLAENLERAQKAQEEGGVTAIVDGLGRRIVRDQANIERIDQENIAANNDNRTLEKYRSSRAADDKILSAPAGTVNDWLTNTRAATRRAYAASTSVMPPDVEAAWARDQLRRMGGGGAPEVADAAQSQTFRAIANDGYEQRVESQRGRHLGSLVKSGSISPKDGREMSMGPTSGPPQPGRDPRRGGFLIQGFDEAASKAEKVKQTVDELGPAGQKSSAILAAGFNTALSGMETEAAQTIARIQKLLDSLKVPSLNFGGAGGLNTGRSMGEVR